MVIKTSESLTIRQTFFDEIIVRSKNLYVRSQNMRGVEIMSHRYCYFRHTRQLALMPQCIEKAYARDISYLGSIQRNFEQAEWKVDGCRYDHNTSIQITQLKPPIGAYVHCRKNGKYSFGLEASRRSDEFPKVINRKSECKLNTIRHVLIAEEIWQFGTTVHWVIYACHCWHKAHVRL